jgi:PAS domain S-box-containing protein
MSVKPLWKEVSELRPGWDFVLPVSIAVFLAFVSIHNFLLFHTLAELFAIGVALLMCIVAWQSYPFSQNHFLMFLACGYFWIGGLDLIHTLVFKDIDIFTVTGANPTTQFWISSRYLEALLLLIAPLFLQRSFNRRVAFLGFGLVALIVYILVMSGNFPDTFIEGSGLTKFKIYSEYIIIGLLAGALLHLKYSARLMRPHVLFLLCGSIIFTMMAELAFTSYISFYDLSFVLGHVFKLFSYWLIFLAIVRTSLREPFLELEQRVNERTSELEVTRDELTRVVNIARLGHWRIDEVADEYVTISEEFARIFGYSIDEFLDRYGDFEKDMELKHPDDREMTSRAYDLKEDIELDYRILHRDGGVRYVHETCKYYSDENGNITESMGTIQDITEQKEADVKLKESKERFRDFAGATSDWFWETDKQHKFIWESESGESITGVPFDTIQGKTRWELPGPVCGDEEFWKPHKSLLESHQAFHNFEFSCFADAGRTIFLQIGGVPVFDAVGEFKGYRGSTSNITVRKQAERALEIARDEAESANRSKSEFLSSMSHELRTPMNAILGFAQLLDIDPNDPLSEKQKSFVDHILKSGTHLMELIDQILELNKIEAGKLSINFDHIGAYEIIEESLKLVETMAQQEAVEIVNQIDRDELPIIWTDHTRLTQALLNLLSNAIKYNRKDGTVTISCQETSEHMLRISVTDTGIGIPEEKQHDLFVPFDRLGREAGEIQGTGIGLTITKQLIELLGGKLGFQSEEDKGSTFTIEVPVSPRHVPGN